MFWLMRNVGMISKILTARMRTFVDIKVGIWSLFVNNGCTKPLQTSLQAGIKRYCKLWILWDYRLLNEAVPSDRANSSKLISDYTQWSCAHSWDICGIRGHVHIYQKRLLYPVAIKILQYPSTNKPKKSTLIKMRNIHNPSFYLFVMLWFLITKSDSCLLFFFSIY